MKTVFNELSADFKTITVLPIFDVHIGSPKCRYKELMADIEKVKQSPNTFIVLGGDLINNSTKASVGDVYEEALSPMSQIKKACDVFYDVKDKILCITSGNHERRSYKQDGIDLMYFFASELGIADKYDYNSCVCVIKFGSQVRHSRQISCKSGAKVQYSMYVTHGDGNGGRTVGGKANGLERRGNIVPNVDVVVTGHTHQNMAFQEMCYLFDEQNKTVREHVTTYVNASAYLGYEGYAELYGMKPSVCNTPNIIFNGEKKEVMTYM